MEELSRNEALLDALVNGTTPPEIEPKSRMEAYLQALCEKGNKPSEDIDNHTHSWNNLEDRPFYEEGNKEYILSKQLITFNDNGFANIDSGEEISYEVGQIVNVVFDGEKYETEIKDGYYRGDNAIVSRFTSSGGIEITIVWDTYFVSADLTGDHTIEIYMGETIVKQIDEKFIPDYMKLQPDWNQNDETASDFVKHRTHYDSREYREVNLEFDNDISGDNCILTYEEKDEENDLLFREYFIKVSDDIYNSEDFLGAKLSYTFYENGESVTEEYIIEEEHIYKHDGLPVVSVEGLLCFYEPCELEGFSYEKGIYNSLLIISNINCDTVYSKEYNSSISFNVTKGELKQLDAKYIPESISDWNTLKNRPFYQKEREVIFDGELTFDDNGQGNYPFILERGIEYMIIIDGKEYISELIYDDLDYYIQLELDDGCIIIYEYGYCSSTKENTTYHINVSKEGEIVPFDTKYLPDSIVRVDTKQDFSDNEKKQARTNIDTVSISDISPNFVWVGSAKCSRGGRTFYVTLDKPNGFVKQNGVKIIIKSMPSVALLNINENLELSVSGEDGDHIVDLNGNNINLDANRDVPWGCTGSVAEFIYSEGVWHYIPSVFGLATYDFYGFVKLSSSIIDYDAIGVAATPKLINSYLTDKSYDLTTTDKTIVGAINELYSEIQTLKEQVATLGDAT